MAFVAGKTTSGVYVGSQDLTGYTRSWSISLQGAVHETTNFNSNGSQEFIRGMKGGSAQIGGMLDPSIDAALASAISATGSSVLTIVPEAQTIGTRVYGGRVLSSTWSPTASVGGLVDWTLTMSGDGIGAGVLLKDSTAITTTGAEASYDSGTGNVPPTDPSTTGAVWFVNVFADDFTSMTFDVEDSANDIAWASVGSATVTTTGASSGLVSGNIDRYLRFNVTAFTGTSASVVAGLIRL